MESVEEHEGIIVQVWMNCEGELHIFAVYFWHSEGWTTRNEALLEAIVRTRDSPLPWLTARDANTEPDAFV